MKPNSSPLAGERWDVLLCPWLASVLAADLFVPLHPHCLCSFSNDMYLGKSFSVKHLTCSMTSLSWLFVSKSL